jgi:hypothetical protein
MSVKIKWQLHSKQHDTYVIQNTIYKSKFPNLLKYSYNNTHIYRSLSKDRFNNEQ